MMGTESYWKIDGLKDDRLVTPKDMIQIQCDHLADATDRKVIGRITEYEGEYPDRYPTVTIEPGPAAFGLGSDMASVKTFDVQSVLGEDSRFAYLFFITSAATPKYRSKICVLYYDVFLYPAHLVLERSLAEELGLPAEIAAEDRSAFEGYLKKILSSERITRIVSNLFSMNR